MRIERIEELRLTAADDAGIAALLAASFGTEFGGRSYFMQRQHARLVARDPEIVGHVGLTFRAIRLGERLVPILGLADVATSAERRGQGIARMLVDATIAEGQSSPAEYIVLFGTAHLYAAAGFRAQPNRLRFVDMTDARTGKIAEDTSDSLMVMSLRGAHWDPSLPIDFLGHLF